MLREAVPNAHELPCISKKMKTIRFHMASHRKSIQAILQEETAIYNLYKQSWYQRVLWTRNLSFGVALKAA